MAMPLSLSANTSTSSGASGGYSAAQGRFSGMNITNIGASSIGNILNALTGSQGAPLTGGITMGSGGYLPGDSTQTTASADVSASPVGISGSVSWTPMILVAGIALVAFMGMRK